jgi:hypothetical protein
LAKTSVSHSVGRNLKKDVPASVETSKRDWNEHPVLNETAVRSGHVA